jgi:regulatory protein
MYDIKEFDNKKTKVLKYIIYKKRTEYEVRTKFKGQIDEEMLEDIITYLKESGYINDSEFIEKQVNEYMLLKTMSIKELKYKLYAKGLDKKLIEKYVEQNYEKLQNYENQCIKKIKAKKEQTMSEQEIQQYLYKKGYRSE